MTYYKYTFVPKSEHLDGDSIIGILSDFDFETFVAEENRVEAYLPDNQHLEIDLLHEKFRSLGHELDIAKEIIPDQNWNAKWEEDYPVVELGSKLIVRAPFHAIDSDKYQMDIQIQPKMSFGTGHHETTYMMLDYLLDAQVGKKRVLDMGSGTGVLAIAAFKLGAKHVKAVDIEEWAYENTLENVALNSAQVDVDKGDILKVKGEVFDFILANINKNVLLSDMKSYSEALFSQGSLYLSGFFGTDVDEIVTKAEMEELQFVSEKRKGDWAAIHLIKQTK